MSASNLRGAPVEEVNTVRIGNHNTPEDTRRVPPRRRRSNFTPKETVDLLQIWSSLEWQWKMKHNVIHFKVWEAIASRMNEKGHERTANQCKHRIQNLLSEFHRIRKSKQDPRSFNFPYYKLVGEMLNERKNATEAALTRGIEFCSALAGSINNSSSGRIAAHKALVQDNQHLIRGNPETKVGSFAERNSSSNARSTMIPLSYPQVSLSGDNSRIRVKTEALGSRSSTFNKFQSSSTCNPKAIPGSVNWMPFVNRIEVNSQTPAPGYKKDNVRMRMEHGGSDQDQHQEASDYNVSYESVGDDGSTSAENGRCSLNGVGKLTSQSTFNPCNKLKSMYAGKRRRVASPNASSSLDDPILPFIAEMVDIERQLLEIEHERAHNEGAMQTCVMQILQANLRPNQSQQEQVKQGDEKKEVEEQANQADIE